MNTGQEMHGVHIIKITKKIIAELSWLAKVQWLFCAPPGLILRSLHSVHIVYLSVLYGY
jgi:hypothetical protein